MDSSGYESYDTGDLLRQGSHIRVLGPLVGIALSLPIFDGGTHNAGMKQARVTYEKNVTNYRESVLVAFREVEDDLSKLCLLADQIKTQDDAVCVSTRTAQLSRTRYSAKSANYLGMIDTGRNVLSAECIDMQLAGSRMNSIVGFIRVLGGDWGNPPLTVPVTPANTAAAANMVNVAQPTTVAQQ